MSGYDHLVIIDTATGKRTIECHATSGGWCHVLFDCGCETWPDATFVSADGAERPIHRAPEGWHEGRFVALCIVAERLVKVEEPSRYVAQVTLTVDRGRATLSESPEVEEVPF